MKKTIITFCAAAILCSCTSLTYQEKSSLRSLKAEGISVDKPVGGFEKPASPAAAGLLNLLPGFGNFYLAAGDGADGDQWLYGFGNFLLWPISVVWAIPEAAIDAGEINKRELVYFYTYDKMGKKSLADYGFELTITGELAKVK